MSETRESASKRSTPRVVRGVVIRDKMNKSRIIQVKRHIKHSFYHKDMIRHSRIAIHDEKNESRVGDTVLAVACRPLSKLKHYRLKSITVKGQ